MITSDEHARPSASPSSLRVSRCNLKHGRFKPRCAADAPRYPSRASESAGAGQPRTGSSTRGCPSRKQARALWTRACAGAGRPCAQHPVARVTRRQRGERPGRLCTWHHARALQRIGRVIADTSARVWARPTGSASGINIRRSRKPAAARCRMPPCGRDPTAAPLTKGGPAGLKAADGTAAGFSLATANRCGFTMGSHGPVA